MNVSGEFLPFPVTWLVSLGVTHVKIRVRFVYVLVMAAASSSFSLASVKKPLSNSIGAVSLKPPSLNRSLSRCQQSLPVSNCVIRIGIAQQPRDVEWHQLPLLTTLVPPLH